MLNINSIYCIYFIESSFLFEPARKNSVIRSDFIDKKWKAKLRTIVEIVKKQILKTIQRKSSPNQALIFNIKYNAWFLIFLFYLV